MKDVRVPEQLQRAMAAEAEAAREARAKVIAAEGEHKASRALRHAAEIIAECPAALQVYKGWSRKKLYFYSLRNSQCHSTKEKKFLLGIILIIPFLDQKKFLVGGWGEK